MKRGRFFRGFFQNSLQNNRDDIDKTRRNGYTGKSEFFIKLIQGGFRMNKPVLVVLAAGMGSRYGGLKQIDPMGKNGEKILDYSVYDAKRAGFETVVFVIKPEMEQEFEEAVGKSHPVKFGWSPDPVFLSRYVCTGCSAGQSGQNQVQNRGFALSGSGHVHFHH